MASFSCLSEGGNLMSRKLMLGMVVLLLTTNIMTLLFWKTDKKVLINDNREIITKDPVASIGEEEIFYKDWMDSLQSVYGKTHLENMMDRLVVQQLTKQADIAIHDKIIERDLSLLISMQGIMTEEEIAEKTNRWREEILHRHQLEALLADQPITEEEIRAHYNQYEDQYDFTESVQLSHIVLDTYHEAEQVLAELDDGASFNLLAKEYSIDQETVDRGGYIGFITRTNSLMDEQYLVMAGELDEDSYSDPFQVNGGFAIVYLHLKLPEISFTYEEIKPYIKTELSLQKLEQPVAVDQLKDRLLIDWIYE